MFVGRFVKLHFSCQEEFFREKLILNIIIFSNFNGTVSNTLRFLGGKFWGGYFKTDSFVSQDSFWGKTKFFEKIIVLMITIQLWLKISESVFKTAFMEIEQVKYLGDFFKNEKIYMKNWSSTILISFQALSNTFCTSGEKLLVGVFETEFYIPGGNFRKFPFKQK